MKVLAREHTMQVERHLCLQSCAQVNKWLTVPGIWVFGWIAIWVWMTSVITTAPAYSAKDLFKMLHVCDVLLSLLRIIEELKRIRG